jgi:PAS domain S-box-containing protein
LGLAVYDGVEAMVRAHPELDLVVAVSGEISPERLRAVLPAGVGLVEPAVAEFLRESLTSDKQCLRCRFDLGRARHLLQAVTDQAQEDVLLLDLEGRIVFANQSVAARLGEAGRNLIGRACWDFRGLDRHFCDEDGPYRTAIVTGTNAEQTYTAVDEEGRMLYLRVYAYPIQNDEGSLEHILLMRRDITRRTNMERRLQQSEKLAAIGELSTFIAHEIRNPLFAIGGFANSLLRASSLDEPAREKVKIILEESKRLDTILKSIINFARPSHSAPGEVDVNRVVAETMALMCIGCGEMGIKVAFEYGAHLARARCDPEMLKQCVINLVKNAMEALEAVEGERVLTARTGMTDAFVFLEIRDTGKGIAPEIMDQVFSPFFSTKDKGSGLGLAMVRKSVDDLGGRVELHSKVGEGTGVILYLPPALAEGAEGTEGAGDGDVAGPADSGNVGERKD